MLPIVSEQVSFIVPGVPVAKGRARATRSGHHYTPAKTRAAEAAVRAAWIEKFGTDREPHKGPVELHVLAMFPIPKSWPKSKREGALFHTSRPDLDNVVKLIKDALNGLAWVDDSSVVKLSASKNYTVVSPKTSVSVTFYSES